MKKKKDLPFGNRCSVATAYPHRADSQRPASYAKARSAFPNREDRCSRKGAGSSERESCRPQAMLLSRGLTNTSSEAPPISASRLPSSQSSHGPGRLLASLTRNLWLAPGDPRFMCWKFNVCFLFSVLCDRASDTRSQVFPWQIISQVLKLSLICNDSLLCRYCEASSLIHSRSSMLFLNRDPQNASQFSRSDKYNKHCVSVNGTHTGLIS